MGRTAISTLRRRAVVTLCAVGVVVAVGVTGTAAFRRVGSAMVRQVQQADQFLADERARELANTIEQAELRLRDSATRPLVVDAVERADVAVLQLAVAHAANAPGVRRLTISGVAGEVLYAHTSDRMLLVPRTQIVPAADHRDARLQTVVDIRSSDDRLLGRLHQELSIGALLPGFASETSMVSGLVTLVSIDGRVLMSARPGRPRVSAPAVLDAAASGRRRLVSYYSPSLQSDRLAAVSPVSGTTTAVIAGADEAEAYGPARRLLLELGLISAGGLSVALLLLTIIGVVLRRRRRHLEVAGAASRLLAMTDPLTGVGNRRALEQALIDARDAGRAAQLISIDLDDFKRLNDTFGHATGDGALRRAADAMRLLVRDGDVVARLGGDEFVILQTFDGPPRESLVADRLRHALQAIVIDGYGPLRVSVGSANATSPVGLDHLMDVADEALYADKRSRKASPVGSNR